MKKSMLLIIGGIAVAAILTGILIFTLVRKNNVYEINPDELNNGFGSEQIVSELPLEGDYVHYDGKTELIAVPESMEEAEEIAKLYGIELKSYSGGVAVYLTEENPREVINRGKENGWPAIDFNHIYHIDPIERPVGDRELIY